MRSFQALISYMFEPAIHTMIPLYTVLFGAHVGDVGNRGRVCPFWFPFSKTPELHRHNLENSAICQTTSRQLHQKVSHFSLVNYGYYYLFFNLLLFFLYPVAPSRHNKNNNLFNGIATRQQHSPAATLTL
jgi:hypothetical protein